MEKFNEKYLENNRVGNNATDSEWKTIKNLLCYGNLYNREDIEICYKNINENKKWYYKINKDALYDDEISVGKGIIFALTLLIGLPIISSTLEDILGIGAMSMISSGAIFIGFNVAVSKFINKLVYENDIDQLQRNLGKAIDPNRKTSLKDRLLSLFSRKASKKVEVKQSLADYVDEELVKKGSNQDAEIIKMQNEEHASAFVKLIGKDMKSIIAYPYPNCEDELNALRDLANEYVENMAKEQEANLTSKIALKLSGSKDFYGRLNELEAKIKRNMEINKIRRYNDGYLCDIIKDTSKAVEQSPYVYDIPAVSGHISNVEEQFNAELQNSVTGNTTDNGHGRILSPNNK